MRRITSALHASSRGLGKLRQRNAVRAFVHLPAWLTIDRDDTSEHVAFVRDISARGIFFYSDVEAAAAINSPSSWNICTQRIGFGFTSRAALFDLNNQPRTLPLELPSHSRRVSWAQRFFEIEPVARTERLQRE
jgi:hypothetical protein